MLLSPGLGSAWGWGCVLGDGGDLLPEKHSFPWKKEGERAEKLLPVKFAAWLEAAEGLVGARSPSPAQGLGSGSFGRWHFTAAWWEGQKNHSRVQKPFPNNPQDWRKNSWEAKLMRPTLLPDAKGGLGARSRGPGETASHLREKKENKKAGGAGMLRETTFFLPASSKAFNSQLVFVLQSDCCPTDLAHSPPPPPK